MSDKKPDVFQTKNTDNMEFPSQISSAEELAANKMKRRTEEQIKLRSENLAKSEEIARETEKTRLIQMEEKNAHQSNQNSSNQQMIEPTVNYPQVTKAPELSDIEIMSQPQMNQAFDVIPLPSEGKLYPSKKKSIKVAYLTTADENILTSPNLVDSGQFLEILLNRKILEPELRYSDLHTGDRNAIMVWLRATGYGTDYQIQMLDKNNVPFETSFDLSTLKTIKLGAEPDLEGLFYFKMPLSGDDIKFKLLSVGDVDAIGELLELDKVNGVTINTEPTHILNFHIIEVNGDRSRDFIKEYSNNIRTLDAQKLRKFISSIESGIDLNVDIKTPGGGSITTFLPINPSFFWPNSEL
jgi:hypothetical protein